MSRAHLVIVGASAAGLSALEAIRQVDPDAHVTLVSQEERPAYSRVMLPHLLAGEQASAEIRTAGYFRDLGVNTVFGRGVAAVEPGSLRLEDGGRIDWDRLLLATGATPRTPPIPGIDADGVCTLRTLADAEALSRRLRGARSAVVIGGGRICVLACRAFLSLGVHVEVVETEPTILSGMLDREGSERARARLEEHGIRFHTGTGVMRIASGARGVESVVTSTGDEIRADLVLVAAGNLPCVELARLAGLRVSRGVLVDRTLRTSLDGVYAAGDVAETPDLVAPDRTLVCGTWSEAVRQGRAAGLAMTGRDGDYQGSLRMNALGVMGLPSASIGETDPGADCHATTSSLRRTYRKLVLRGDRLVGAVLVGDVDDAGVLAGLVRSGRPVQGLGVSSGRTWRYGDVLGAALRASLHGHPLA